MNRPNAASARPYLLPVLLFVGLSVTVIAIAPRLAPGRPSPEESSPALEALREAFNAERDRPRLLAVLAPTCPICREGAHDVAGLRARFGDEVWAAIVWTRALPWDLDQKVGKWYGELRGSGLALFDDPGARVSSEVARTLGWPGDGAAWDVYLVWPAGVVWHGELPPPAVWFHQRHELGGEAFRRRDELGVALAGVLQGLADGRTSGAAS